MPALNRKTWLTLGGYAAFFVCCFMLFAYLSFPYERLRDVLVAKAESSAAPGTRLQIGELGPHWLTGVTLTGVDLERPPAAPGASPSKIEIDKLTVRAAPFTLLFGGVGLHFDARMGKGEIDGSYSAKKNGPAHIEADLDALDLAGLGLDATLGVPVRGTASGRIDLTLSDQPVETQGKVELRIEQLKLGDGKAKVRIPGLSGGLTLETVNAGTLELDLSVKDGLATINRMEAKGSDVELSGSGSLRVVRNFGQSMADLTLGVKVKDAYARHNERTKAMFELFKASLSRFASADGMMRFRLAGPLINLRAAPAGPSTPVPIRKRAH